MALIECELARVVLSEMSTRQVVVLQEKGGDRELPILVGMFEVLAIHRTLNREPPPRPLTHELFGGLLSILDIQLQKVVINDLRDNTFYGRMFVQQNGKVYDVDSRPSDAIALAVQKRAPIFVEESVFEKADS
jgi:bifunctional DNase/RNase